MATLETAGGPLQSLWSPTPTCMHADSCQKPHLPLFMAILPEQRLTSTQKSPGTAMHARGYDRSTKLIGSTVDPTMDYTTRPVNPNVRHKGVTATSMTTHHIIAHQYSKNTEKDTTFFTPFTRRTASTRTTRRNAHSQHAGPGNNTCRIPRIGRFPSLPTIPEGSVWHGNYTWATRKAPLRTYPYRPHAAVINAGLQQVTFTTTNPQPLRSFISTTFHPNQSYTVFPARASLTFSRRTRLPTIAESEDTSTDAGLPLHRRIVRVRRNCSPTQPQSRPKYHHTSFNTVPPAAKQAEPTTESHHPQVHPTITTNSHRTTANVTTDRADDSMRSAATQPNHNRRIVHVRRANSFHHGKKIAPPYHSQRPATLSTTAYPNSNTVITPLPATDTLPQPETPQFAHTEPCTTHHHLPDTAPALPSSNSGTDRTETIRDELAEIHQPNLPFSTTSILRESTNEDFPVRSSHATTSQMFLHSTSMSTAPESPWHHRIRVFCKHRQIPLPSIAVGSYTAATNKTCTNTRYTQYGEKEFFSHPVSTTRRTHLAIRTTCDSHSFWPDNDCTAILTGIPWYRPVLTSANTTPNFRPGPPPWPPPTPLLQTSPLPMTPTLFTSSSYDHYCECRTFPRRSHQLDCVVRPTTPNRADMPYTGSGPTHIPPWPPPYQTAQQRCYERHQQVFHRNHHQSSQHPNIYPACVASLFTPSTSDKNLLRPP